MASIITFSTNLVQPLTLNLDVIMNFTFSAAQTGTPGPLPEVEYVTLSSDITSGGLIWTDGTIPSPEATITGQLLCDVFEHTAEYVSCGSSDKIEVPSPPTTLRHPDILAGDKEIFNFPNIDTAPTVDMIITATAHLDDATEVYANYTITINNNVASIKTWIQNYFANKPSTCP